MIELRLAVRMSWLRHDVELDDWQRPLDGKFFSSRSMRYLEPGQKYRLTTVGFGDAVGDTLLGAERVE